MEKKSLAQIQIGKQGITDNFIETLKGYFKNHKNVKISVLKSARPEGKKGKETVKEYSDKISSKLGNNFNIRTIGFTIAIKKLKKNKDFN